MIFKSPLVVGYKGEIGSFILKGLLREMSKALNIWCYDINEIRCEQVERIERADVIFLCLPIEETLRWFENNKGLLRGKTVIEQCSLKKEICEKIKKLEKEWDFRLISIHLLFRPSATPNKEDRRCLVIGNTSKIKQFAWDICKVIDSDVFFLDNYDEHDKLMARKQALVHRVILELDKTIEDGVDTYTSSVIRKLATRIKAGDEKLYKFIQTNEFLPKILKEFKERL